MFKKAVAAAMLLAMTCMPAAAVPAVQVNVHTPGAFVQQESDSVQAKDSAVTKINLSLEEALTLAESNNDLLKMAKIKLDSAIVDADQAKSDAKKIEDLDDNNMTQGTVTEGQIRYANPKAKALAKEVAQKNYKVSHEQVKLMARSKYFAVAQAIDELKVKKAALERAENQLKNARAGFEVGTIVKTDVLQAEMGLSSARANYMVAEKDLRVTEMELCKFIGLDINKGIVPVSTVSHSAPPQADLEKTIQEAGENRLDVASARADRDAAQENYKVVVSYTAKNTYLAKRAKFTLDMAELSLDSANKDVVASLTAGWSSVLAANEAYLALSKGAEAARENMRLTELRYSVGVATTLDVVTASEKMAEMEAQAVAALHRYNMALYMFDTLKVSSLPAL